MRRALFLTAVLLGAGVPARADIRRDAVLQAAELEKFDCDKYAEREAARGITLPAEIDQAEREISRSRAELASPQGADPALDAILLSFFDRVAAELAVDRETPAPAPGQEDAWQAKLRLRRFNMCEFMKEHMQRVRSLKRR